MRDFLTNLWSFHWWISVVVVGLLINIASVYIARKLDSRLSRGSAWWRRRSEKEKLKRKQEVIRARSSHHELIMMALTEIRYRISAIVFGSLGLTTFGVGASMAGAALVSGEWNDRVLAAFGLLLGAIFLLTAVSQFYSAMTISSVIDEARQDNSSQRVQHRK